MPAKFSRDICGLCKNRQDESTIANRDTAIANKT
jgi:hypothetical protein